MPPITSWSKSGPAHVATGHICREEQINVAPQLDGVYIYNDDGDMAVTLPLALAGYGGSNRTKPGSAHHLHDDTMLVPFWHTRKEKDT